MLKLACVLVLTINGIALHFLAFPALCSDSPLSLRTSAFLGATGALSTSHWLMAAFLGLAKPLGKLPVSTLFMGYLGICCVAVLIGLASVPGLRRRLTDWRVSRALRRISYHPYLAFDVSPPLRSSGGRRGRRARS